MASTPIVAVVLLTISILTYVAVEKCCLGVPIQIVVAIMLTIPILNSVAMEMQDPEALIHIAVIRPRIIQALKYVVVVKCYHELAVVHIAVVLTTFMIQELNYVVGVK